MTPLASVAERPDLSPILQLLEEMRGQEVVAEVDGQQVMVTDDILAEAIRAVSHWAAHREAIGRIHAVGQDHPEVLRLRPGEPVLERVAAHLETLVHEERHRHGGAAR